VAQEQLTASDSLVGAASRHPGGGVDGRAGVLDRVRRLEEGELDGYSPPGSAPTNRTEMNAAAPW
jgi:hypothetical protein